jgi:hypothetical protein
MTTDRKLKIVFGILSVGLLTTLIIKLTNVPGGMILSGLFLGGMMIVGIILGCLILTGNLKLTFKRTSFLTVFIHHDDCFFCSLSLSIVFSNLDIKVPNGYVGEINLVLS